MRRRLTSLTVLVVVILGALAPVAEAACPKTSLLDIQDEVMCVICGVPLVNANGPQSDKQRDFIRKRAGMCESADEIKNALVAEYGPAVLAMPRRSGFDLAAYVVPLIALTAALAAITAGALRWRRKSAQAEPQAAASNEVLDADMQRYDL